VTIVWCRVLLLASNLLVTLPKRVPQDNEECRLFALYEASSDKEIAATYRLLYPSHRLLHPEYTKLVAALRVLRMECNDEMLAILAHHKKMLGFSALH
jgi:hypothetical protein